MSSTENRPRRAIEPDEAAQTPQEQPTPPSRSRTTPKLLEVGGRPPLGVYLHQLLGRRHFAWTQASAQAMSRNTDNALGNIWLILNPVLDAFAYFVIFAVILKTDRGMDNFFAFIVLGVFLFRYSQRCLSTGAGLMRSQRGLIRAFAFPRATLPLAALIRETLSTIPVILVALVLVIVVPPHAYPNRLWILLPAVLFLQLMFNFGLMLIAARITDAVPDIASAIRVVSRFWMYGSGVIFPIDRFLDHPTAMFIIELNPLYHVLVLARSLVIDATIPPASSWLILAAYAVGFFTFGFIYFWRGEVNYGRE